MNRSVLKFVHLCKGSKMLGYKLFYGLPLNRSLWRFTVFIVVVYPRDLNCFLKTYKKHISCVRSSTS